MNTKLLQQPQLPHYIAFQEGFAIFELMPDFIDDDGIALIHKIAFSHFTRDIRKATAIWDRDLAFGIAKCLDYKKVSKANHYCVLEPSISNAITDKLETELLTIF